MARIEHFDKRVGIKYVYESESYYDKEKHQSRSKRKLIGKIDPETGEMVPTGKKGRPAKNTTPDNEQPDYKKLYQSSLKDLKRCGEQIRSLEKELHDANGSIKKYCGIIQKISSLCNE